MKKATALRFERNGFQTISYQKFDTGETVFFLEPPDLNNKTDISCIPVGVYHVLPHVSPKFGKCFKIFTPGKNDVAGRDEVLDHVGNYRKNTKGCRLPGLGVFDINKDGKLDVSDSRKALTRLFKIAPDGYELTIINV